MLPYCNLLAPQQPHCLSTNVDFDFLRRRQFSLESDLYRICGTDIVTSFFLFLLSLF